MNWLKKLFTRKKKEPIKWHYRGFPYFPYADDFIDDYGKRTEFWTPELIEWLNKENDSLVLSVTACLVNCHHWPSWLPSKPNDYEDRRNNKWLKYICHVISICEHKANLITPGLYDVVWATQRYYTFDGYDEKMAKEYAASLTGADVRVEK